MLLDYLPYPSTNSIPNNLAVRRVKKTVFHVDPSACVPTLGPGCPGCPNLPTQAQRERGQAHSHSPPPPLKLVQLKCSRPTVSSFMRTSSLFVKRLCHFSGLFLAQWPSRACRSHDLLIFVFIDSHIIHTFHAVFLREIHHGLEQPARVDIYGHHIHHLTIPTL